MGSIPVVAFERKSSDISRIERKEKGAFEWIAQEKYP
jgi:hypothetical protein